MASLIFSEEATTDLETIIDYLVQAAGTATAERYGERFRAAFRQLSDFPGSGSPRPQFGASMRLWIVPPYLIFYRHVRNDATANIIRIIDGRRRLSDKLFGNS